MELTAVGIMVTAAVMGVTHGIEPDHVAGIASLSTDARSSRHSMLVGALFASGHVLLVLLWVGLAYTVVDVSAFVGTLEAVGTTLVGTVLVLLGGVIGVSAVRKVVHEHEHGHEHGQRHAHLHVHLPWMDEHRIRLLPEHEHRHTRSEYVKIGVIGALFTFSPPVSMIAFISVVVPNTNVEIVGLAILAYAVSITAMMTTVGFGTNRLVSISRAVGDWAHTTLQVTMAVLILALGLYLLWGPVSNLFPLL